MRAKSREVVDGALAVRCRDHKCRVRTDFASHTVTLLHAASTAAMKSVKVPSRNSGSVYKWMRCDWLTISKSAASAMKVVVLICAYARRV